MIRYNGEDITEEEYMWFQEELYKKSNKIANERRKENKQNISKCLQVGYNKNIMLDKIGSLVLFNQLIKIIIKW